MIHASVGLIAKVGSAYPILTTMDRDNVRRHVRAGELALASIDVFKPYTQSGLKTVQTQVCRSRWGNGSIFVHRMKPVKSVMIQPIALLMAFASQRRTQFRPRLLFQLNVVRDAMETINAQRVIAAI